MGNQSLIAGKFEDVNRSAQENMVAEDMAVDHLGKKTWPDREGARK
nr:hypothetical protein [Thaumasiovibrio occultus]